MSNEQEQDDLQQQTIEQLASNIARRAFTKRNLRTHAHPALHSNHFYFQHYTSGSGYAKDFEAKDVVVTYPLTSAYFNTLRRKVLNSQPKKELREDTDSTATNSVMYVTYIADYSNGKSKQTEKPKEKEQERQDIQSLDIGDLLKTLCHQKRVLSPKLREILAKIHMHTQMNSEQESYKHLLMIASQASYRKLDHPGYYRAILEERSKYPDLFFGCINKDIPRTMPDDHPLQDSLRNVLYAYAIRNPSVLYCQGMNYLVGFLLINRFGEEEAFWLLVQLVEDILLPNFFKDLSTISITVQIFEDVMRQVFPELAHEMDEVGMESGIFLVGWYICLFTKGFINSVSQFLLQEIVLESFCFPIGFTLIRISLGIFTTLFTREQRFEFQEKDFKSLKESIQGSVYEISLQELRVGMSYFEFNFDSYLKLERLYTHKREQLFSKALQKELQEKKISLPPCNMSKPVCIHRVEIEKKIGTVEEVLILKNNISIRNQYTENYFAGKMPKLQPKIVYENADECPITHHSHVCHLASVSSKLAPHKKLAEQSCKYSPVLHDGQCSGEIESRFSRVEDRFSELSEFFIVDDSSPVDVENKGLEREQRISHLQDNKHEHEHEHENEMVEVSIEARMGQHDELDEMGEAGSKHSQSQHNGQFNIISSVGNVFRKAYDSIKLLKSNLKDKHKSTPPTHLLSNANGKVENEEHSNYTIYMANKLSENSP